MDIDCIFKNTSVVSMNRKQCPLVLLHPTYFMYLLPKSIALENKIPTKTLKCQHFSCRMNVLRAFLLTTLVALAIANPKTYLVETVSLLLPL